VPDVPDGATGMAACGRCGTGSLVVLLPLPRGLLCKCNGCGAQRIIHPSNVKPSGA
jgi:hypothetical protein